MDSLRVSLIIIGVVILLLLYLGSRYLQGRREKQAQAQRSEPSFADQMEQAQQEEWEVIPVKDVVQSSFFDPGLQYSFHLSLNASFCSSVSAGVSRCHFLLSDHGFLLPPILKPKRILLNINNAIACQKSITLRFAALAIE